MPVRFPPEPLPQNGQKLKDRPRSRIVAYSEPRPGFGRRVLRPLLSPIVVIPLLALLVIVAGCLIYYWTIFSGRIDNLLKGEVFTRSAGIYAAPKQLRVGEMITPDRLVELLKHAGYVDKTQQADKARGRYSIGDSSVDIEPSENNTIDGQRQFQSV